MAAPWTERGAHKSTAGEWRGCSNDGRPITVLSQKTTTTLPYRPRGIALSPTGLSPKPAAGGGGTTDSLRVVGLSPPVAMGLCRAMMVLGREFHQVGARAKSAFGARDHQQIVLRGHTREGSPKDMQSQTTEDLDR